MSKGLVKLYKAKLEWRDKDFGPPTVVVGSCADHYPFIPDEIDVRVWYWLDNDVQPVAPEDLGDCVVVAFSEDYEEVWFDVETNDEWGECDNCGKQYELASREGRCGDCGNCSNCCDHFLKEEN